MSDLSSQNYWIMQTIKIRQNFAPRAYQLEVLTTRLKHAGITAEGKAEAAANELMTTVDDVLAQYENDPFYRRDCNG